MVQQVTVYVADVSHLIEKKTGSGLEFLTLLLSQLQAGYLGSSKHHILIPLKAGSRGRHRTEVSSVHASPLGRQISSQRPQQTSSHPSLAGADHVVTPSGRDNAKGRGKAEGWEWLRVANHW